MNLLLQPENWSPSGAWNAETGAFEGGAGDLPNCTLQLTYVGAGWTPGDTLSGQLQYDEEWWEWTGNLHLALFAYNDNDMFTLLDTQELPNGGEFSFELPEFDPANEYLLLVNLSGGAISPSPWCGEGLPGYNAIVPDGEPEPCTPIAVNNSRTVSAGFVGVAIADVRANDQRCEGDSISTDGFDPPPPALSFDLDTGAVSVNPGAEPGVYSFEYRLCVYEGEASRCSEPATVTVTIVGAGCTDYPICGCVASC